MRSLPGKVLLVAVNAKFIHSCPAVYDLKLYAENYARQNQIRLPKMEIHEYTINQPEDQIYYDILKEKPSAVCFSCYLWNLETVAKLCADLKKARPVAKIVVGGPEVSYGLEGKDLKEQNIDLLIAGEGERAFTAWLLSEIDEPFPEDWQYGQDGKTIWAAPMPDLSELPFLYDDLTPFTNRMIYYEASRGCPFRCAYCLSGAENVKGEKRVRELPLTRVLEELKSLTERGVKQIKFIDRTFNCHAQRTIWILEWIQALPDEVPTNFHFEIEADILTEKMIDLLRGMRPGRVQLEIGIQSTSPEALKACGRNPSTKRLFSNIRRLRERGNLNLHVDLIAGLPTETLERFKQSFNEVYSLHAHQLQLGFLKLLSGSPMEEMTETYGYQFSSHPPYEILKNKYLSSEDLFELKRIEDALEKFYNSGHFVRTLSLIEHRQTPYRIFLGLADRMEREGKLFVPTGVFELYEIMARYLDRLEEDSEWDLKGVLLMDYYTYTPSDRIPEGLEELADGREFFTSGKERKEKAERILRLLDEKDPALKSHRVQIRVLEDRWIAIDYSDKDPVSGMYRFLGEFPIEEE
ncbi:MAG: DUF4080 domain-containing protein [Firmicutes bacterium]|nr:DUF4080 domain-containing protein [Bacillota bacterium]